MQWMPYKDELVVLPVKVVKVVTPQVFGVSSIDKTMAVGCTLDEHVRWQII
jgi:hypothetical protein